MQLLTIVIALGFLQVWGSENPLHKDQWFGALTRKIEQLLSESAALPLLGVLTVASVIVPLAVVLYVLFGPNSGWGGVFLPLSVVLLLYSFGRGEFAEIVSEYTKACYIEDWESAQERAQPLGVVTDDLSQNDWSSLHERVLEEASYRGFERMFAVLFWFVFFGPLGALAYRLFFLFSLQKADDVWVARILWAMEWLPARVLGLSFSFTGNFVGCWSRWRESLLCAVSGTRTVLSRIVMGALSVSEDVTQTCEVTRKELNMLSRLYTRTLWFWLGVFAILTVLI